jgi:N-acetyl-gamma-glutamyl-phosphate reductase common form
VVKVGIYGASSYIGREVSRILLEHPQVEILWTLDSNKNSNQNFHPHPASSDSGNIDLGEVAACDVVFLALPSGGAMNVAQFLLTNGVKIIDLGTDFRLKNRLNWERSHGQTHWCWHLTERVIYGIPELHRNEIKKSKFIANPGGFASASILSLSPLIKADLVEPDKIVVYGLSGTSNIGNEIDVSHTHHPEPRTKAADRREIDLLDTYEIEEQLSSLSDREKVSVSLTPIYVPINRGILAISHCFLKSKIPRQDLTHLYMDFFKNEYFIKFLYLPKESKNTWQYLPYSWISAVAKTNFCYVSFDLDENRDRITVFSVLDSLGKGSAQLAVQNFNILFELEESLGLPRSGFAPY